MASADTLPPFAPCTHDRPSVWFTWSSGGGAFSSRPASSTAASRSTFARASADTPFFHRTARYRSTRVLTPADGWTKDSVSLAFFCCAMPIPPPAWCVGGRERYTDIGIS